MARKVLVGLLAVVASSVQAQWRIDPKPLVDIGSTSGADEYLFTAPRSIARMSDGKLIVADHEMRNVRLFDATGKFIKYIGGKGRGPGEYEWPFWVGAGAADTIYVYDYREGPGTLSQYSPAGAFIKRSFVSDMANAAAAQPIRLTSQGLFLNGSVPSSYPRDKPRPYRGESSVIRFQFGDSVKPVLRFPGQVIQTERYPWLVDGVAVMGNASLFIWDGESPTVNVYDLAGKLQRSFTVNAQRRDVSDEFKISWRKGLEKIADERPDMRSSVERQIARTTFPKQFPIFASLQADQADNVWLGFYEQKDSLTLVVDARGREVARVKFPDRFSALTIGRDLVIGLWRDDDDVPHVRVHRLIKQ